MRVLLVCQPVEGGVPGHVDTLARRLPDHGVDVVVAAPPSAWTRRLRHDGITVVDVPMVREVAPASDRGALAQLSGITSASDFDLVHAHSAKAGVLGRIAAWRSGVPAVYTPHAWSFHAATSRATAGVYRAIERALAYRTARIICVSSGERRRGLTVAAAGRLVVVPNGVATPQTLDAGHVVTAERSATSLVVGTVARLAEQKGVDDLIAAMHRVHSQRDDVRLVIAGDGPQRAHLERLARQLGVDDRTRFLGAVTAPWEVLTSLDVFVLPSRWEGMPYTLLEAMAAGLPCVATAVDGVADVIVDRRLGTIVDVGDHERMAREILALIEDVPARRAMGARARDHVRSVFSVDRMVARTTDVYRDVLASADATRARARQRSDHSASAPVPGR